VDGGEVLAGQGGVLIKPEGFPEAFDSLVYAAVVREYGAQVIVRVGEIRP
jgi:hypothetical protein